MFTIRAPYPALTTTTQLPNPKFGDTEGILASFDMKRTMSGQKYTYVKPRGRMKMLWSFDLARKKAQELRELYNAYNSSQVKITDHIGNTYVGYFTSNPFEFESVARHSARAGYSAQQIQVEFEGTLQP